MGPGLLRSDRGNGPPVWIAGRDRDSGVLHQQRLGHRDASTTLRNYAHAMPLEDQAVADDIDEMLRTGGNLQAAPAPVAN